uniref:Cupin 2 conserved barrel domain-containing protein n=1 Tax=Paramoeba aestuarina TaxID=180227 RepID=A0A7S4P8W1_9EUKA|mmetsp:Transcript_38215/g.60483  ORF Transcript_38215/g.60483 Transcript_38215/m.60483 type:complete len:139 (+) Transcript_38215:264-680(+)
MAEDGKTMKITTITMTKEGGSQFGTMIIPLSSPEGAIGTLSPLLPTKNGIFFRETPGDYNFSWHCAPRKQFIINLDAAVQVEVTDGTKKVLEAGEVFFVEDIEGTGHYSSSVGGKTRRSVFIPVDDDELEKIVIKKTP